MTNTQAINNFMFFANNFTPQLLEGMFQVTTVPHHLKSKFDGASGTNGTAKFFNWFMQLDGANKERVCEYINKNYRGE